jgi:FixJ family two-component response regulator
MHARIAFIHQDQSAGNSMVELAMSVGLDAKRYASVDEFLAEADLGEIGCVVLDESLSANITKDFLPARSPGQSQPIPFILLSASEEEPSRRRARDLGAAAFFREPIDGEALLDAIRWALCGRSDAHGLTSAAGD